MEAVLGRSTVLTVDNDSEVTPTWFMVDRDGTETQIRVGDHKDR